MNSGLKLWDEAKKIIPGGNGLLSKRPDRYAPDLWPTYFSKAKGVKIWDLDENEYIDMAQMGMGTAILGYSDDDVNKAVMSAIEDGVNTTLNAPEEVALAKILLNLNPFAGGVKFARTGGEAMSISVRIARTYSKKDKVAFSGYHGWSDWYLATNLTGENNLSAHLLPGLSPKGVPKGLSDTALGFEYNNVEDFKKVIHAHEDIGVIVLEGARYDFPSKEFLDEISKTAKDKGIIVILDEITSGWRLTDGGVYKTNGFQPDIVVYGKAMGNGFAISSVVGKKEVMDSAQDTFISSTFWTERVGFAAGIATLNKLVQHKVWDHLIEMGEKIGQGWEECAKKHGLNIIVTDFKPLITMKFQYGDQNPYIETLFTQLLLEKGYLAANSVYVSYSHTKEIVETYLDNVDTVFEEISRALRKNKIQEMLKSVVKEQGFKRLN